MNTALAKLTDRIRTDLSQFKDHDSVDLVVIGSGAAGFSAALNAAILGARVLLVERMAHVGAPPLCPPRLHGCQGHGADLKSIQKTRRSALRLF